MCQLIQSHNMLHTWCQLQAHIGVILGVTEHPSLAEIWLLIHKLSPIFHWPTSACFLYLVNLSFGNSVLFLQPTLVESHILRLLISLTALTVAAFGIITLTASPLTESLSSLITAMLGTFSAKDFTFPLSVEKLPTWNYFYI